MTDAPQSRPESEWTDPAGAAPEGYSDPVPHRPERSFFTFWRCCGCLAVLGLVLAFASVMVIRWGLEQGLPRMPLEVPTVESDPEVAREIAERLGPPLAAGELISISPDELTVLLTQQIQDEGLPIRFHCAPTPDGLLEILVSVHLVPGPDVPFWLEDRYLNLKVIGNTTIEEGEVVSAEIGSYSFGSFEFEGQDAATSKQIIDEIKNDPRVKSEVSTEFGKVRTFRFDGSVIEIQIDPE